MDNFRKRPNHNLPRRSMDGFVPANSFKGEGSIGFRSRPEAQNGFSDVKPIDDLRRSEGYHPASQPLITSTETSSLPAPILHSGPRHRSRLRGGRRRRLSTGMQPRRTWRTNTKKAFKGLGIAAVAVVLFFVIKLYIVQKNIFKGGGNAPALAQSVDISQLKGEGDGRVNILLLGIGGPGHDGPDLSDTIVIVSIDPVNNQAAMLSIPRDLWVQIPGNGSQKINAAYAYGKQRSDDKNEDDKIAEALKLVDSTLAPVIGIPIHYHAVVDFNAFKKAVDAVGGVTFDVPEQLYDPSIAWENRGNPLIAAKGSQTFDGARALLYARSRETSTDFARGERQRQIMVALKEKIMSAGTYSNPLKIAQLLDSLGDNVYTDFSAGDMNRLYQIATQIPSSSIFSLDLVTPPHNFLTTGNINGLSAVVPRAGTFEYDDVKNYIRNALKDGFIQQENAEIIILNGTETTGLASLKSKELKSYGYNISSVSDAPTKNYTNTILVDLKGNKKYTKHYLEQRLKVTATGSLPAGITAGTADFVIILGSDTTTSE